MSNLLSRNDAFIAGQIYQQAKDLIDDYRYLEVDADGYDLSDLIVGNLTTVIRYADKIGLDATDIKIELDKWQQIRKRDEAKHYIDL